MRIKRLSWVGLLLLPSIGGGVTRAAAPTPVATLTSKVLKVTDAKVGTSDYVEATVGKRYAIGDKIRTGLRAKAEITLDDQSVVRLGQASDITINPNREIDLPKGRIKFDFKNPARIRAGSTVADVRGSFGGFMNEGGVVRGTLIGGQMVVTRPGGGTFTLVPGQSVTINTVNGQTRIETIPSEFTDSSSGEIDPNDPLGDQAFGDGEVNNTAGGPSGEDMRNDSTRQLQDDGAVQNNGLLDEAVNAATGVSSAARITGQFDGPGTGGVNVGLSQRALRNFVANATGGSIGGTTSSGGGTVLLPGSAGGSPQRGYFAPRSDGNVFMYWGQNGAGSAAVRLRTYGAYGQLYYELAAVPTLTFHRAVSRNNVTDGYVIYRDKHLGDFTIGRQRFLKGPVQNTIFGTLLRQGGRDIQDAITWSIKHPKDASVQTDISYIIDAFPSGVATSQKGTQSGVSIRQGFQSKYGSLGLNAVSGNFLRGVGTTFDWSTSAVRNHVDFYGEFGSDGFGREIRTFGLYFPGLHEKTGFDVFVEQAKLDGFGNSNKGNPLHTEWLVRIYRQLGKNVSGLITLDERTDNGLTAGFGLVYKLQF